MRDAEAESFTEKLRGVFEECHRVLRDDGLLVFTYHHSRDEGWQSVAEAVLQSGFVVMNTHPVKSEMSVATPKSQASEPIQLDIVIVCRKAASAGASLIAPTIALAAAEGKIGRLESAGFVLSKNDRKIIALGQLLVCVRDSQGVTQLPSWMDSLKVA